MRILFLALLLLLTLVRLRLDYARLSLHRLRSLELLLRNLLLLLRRPCDSRLKNKSLLILEPKLVISLAIIVSLLTIEVSLELLDALLLHDFLGLGTHGTELLELLQLVLVEVRVLVQSLQHAKLIELLCLQVHERALFTLEVRNTRLVLLEGELVGER